MTLGLRHQDLAVHLAMRSSPQQRAGTLAWVLRSRRRSHLAAVNKELAREPSPIPTGALVPGASKGEERGAASDTAPKQMFNKGKSTCTTSGLESKDDDWEQQEGMKRMAGEVERDPTSGQFGAIIAAIHQRRRQGESPDKGNISAGYPSAANNTAKGGDMLAEAPVNRTAAFVTAAAAGASAGRDCLPAVDMHQLQRNVMTRTAAVGAAQVISHKGPSHCLAAMMALSGMEDIEL